LPPQAEIPAANAATVKPLISAFLIKFLRSCPVSEYLAGQVNLFDAYSPWKSASCVANADMSAKVPGFGVTGC
ncbi:MAG: hypothetical protein KGY54_11650, partial [Oleiphilaceae bacterium]|nr:hypothetical protein [Oleiphilaceae bacterium]